GDVGPRQVAGVSCGQVDGVDADPRRDGVQLHESELPERHPGVSAPVLDAPAPRIRLPYTARKLLQLLATLFAVVVFNFVLFRVLPGDPIQLYARSGRLTPEAAAQLRAVFGLDKPVWDQFWIYFRGLLHGDLGFSLTYREPVSQVVGQRLGNTLILL